MTPAEFETALSTLRVQIDCQEQAFQEVFAICGKVGRLDPWILLIEGASGSGKTTVAHRLRDAVARQHRGKSGPNLSQAAETMPVLIVNTPYGCTRKGLLSEALSQLGFVDAHSTRRSAQQLESLFAKWCERKQVRLIIFEEAQHMVTGSGHEKRNPEMADLQKVLANRVLFPIVLIGTDALDLLCDNEMLHRRVRCRKELKPFAYRTPDQQIEWRSFLAAFDERLPYPYLCGLDSEAFATALYEATGGLPGWFKQLLMAASDNAGGKARRLEPKHFAAAWKELRGFKAGGRPNPFKGVSPLPSVSKNPTSGGLADAA